MDNDASQEPDRVARAMAYATFVMFCVLVISAMFWASLWLWVNMP